MFIVKKDNNFSQGNKSNRFFANTKFITAVGVFVAIKVVSLLINKTPK